MAILIKTKEEIEIMREGGRRLALIVEAVSKKVKPGISTQELEDYTLELIKKGGDKPAFLNYKPYGADRPYPACLCVSVNDEVVHGIPSKNHLLKEGDIVTIDCGLNHKGLFTDHAVSVPVGNISPKAQKLLNITREAMYRGIEKAVGGGKIGDIGNEVQKLAIKNKYGIIRDLSGHGVGREIHEEPYVPNYGKKGTGIKLIPGMTIAIEPMFTLGTDDVDLLDDGYTYVTADGSLAAHFEHTILITEGEPEILTKI